MGMQKILQQLWKTIQQLLTKLNMHLLYDPAKNSYLTKKNGNLYSHKNFYANIYDAFMYTDQKLETNGTISHHIPPTGIWKNQLAHLQNEILLNNKKEK
jgi:hypothetical protein